MRTVAASAGWQTPRDGAPWAFRLEVDTSVKGSMARIQIGSGFQKKCGASMH
jgi:hypothetical protein